MEDERSRGVGGLVAYIHKLTPILVEGEARKTVEARRGNEGKIWLAGGGCEGRGSYPVGGQHGRNHSATDEEGFVCCLGPEIAAAGQHQRHPRLRSDVLWPL